MGGEKIDGPELAAKEAYEEAGLIGEVGVEAIGSYEYLKPLPQGRTRDCRVDVFSMHVHRLLDDWPERKQRKRQWFTLAQAALATAGSSCRGGEFRQL
jgi:8-oxo-dGTP pyrophosphatase MutT (NUDIX family)